MSSIQTPSGPRGELHTSHEVPFQQTRSTALSLAVLDRPFDFTSCTVGRNPSSSGVSSWNRPVATRRAMPVWIKESSPGWKAMATRRPPTANGHACVDNDDDDISDSSDADEDGGARGGSIIKSKSLSICRSSLLDAIRKAWKHVIGVPRFAFLVLE